jgi:hypothetical protein
MLARRWAEERAAEGSSITVEPYPADWDRWPRQAGYRRNAEMVAAGADECRAFIRGGSRGATHCAREAEKAGIPTRRWTADTRRRTKTSEAAA